jgi:hypothetical protein
MTSAFQLLNGHENLMVRKACTAVWVIDNTEGGPLFWYQRQYYLWFALKCVKSKMYDSH